MDDFNFINDKERAMYQAMSEPQQLQYRDWKMDERKEHLAKGDNDRFRQWTQITLTNLFNMGYRDQTLMQEAAAKYPGHTKAAKEYVDKRLADKPADKPPTPVPVPPPVPPVHQHQHAFPAEIDQPQHGTPKHGTLVQAKHRTQHTYKPYDAPAFPYVRIIYSFVASIVSIGGGTALFIYQSRLKAKKKKIHVWVYILFIFCGILMITVLYNIVQIVIFAVGQS